MPSYRINGMEVHMRGSKLPPPCAAMIWIGLDRRFCRAMSAFLCDFPDGGGHTCDRALCEAHAREVGPDRHYCPEHLVEHLAPAKAQAGLFTSLIKEQP